MVIIARGTTNTYVVEELVKLSASHGSFLTGHFVSEGKEVVGKKLKEKRTEIVIKEGKVDMSYTELLKYMQDIIFKAATSWTIAKNRLSCISVCPTVEPLTVFFSTWATIRDQRN